MQNNTDVKHILMLGFGSIGQAVLPLLFGHFNLSAENIAIITATDQGIDIAQRYEIEPIIIALNEDNYQKILSPHLNEGGILLNLSVDVASRSLIELCQKKGSLYLDTSIEPWAGGYMDTTLGVSERSNYALRENILSLKEKYPTGPTALLTHGANPGLVSHMVKQAILNLANDLGELNATPNTQEEWAAMAKKLQIKVIHIAEQDTQRCIKTREADEFLNTWSVDGLLSEGAQPAELGWGTHENYLPSDAGMHVNGCQAAIYLNQPGMQTRVRSWAPNAGPFLGFLITHNEAISLADYFTVKTNDNVDYRPTIHYSYQPCAAALLSIHEFLGKNMQPLGVQKVLKNEITQGMDELGVLLMGHAKGAYWYGSQLTIDEARRRAPYNSATSLQVAVGVLSGLEWVFNHPNEGITEPEQMDHEAVLKVAEQYLGKFVGEYTNWTPLKNRSNLFPEQVDWDDPWQFINFRV